MKLNVGVLRGGEGRGYENSLKSGGAVIANLPREKYRPVDIFIDRNGAWHMDGVPAQVRDLRFAVDVVFNALHDHPEQIASVQRLLNAFNIPFTGPSEARQANLNKSLIREKIRGLGLRAPYHHLIEKDELGGDQDYADYVMAKAKEAFEKVSPPWVVKPAQGSGGADVFIARDFTELALAIKEVLKNNDQIMVEEYVKGAEAAGGVVEDFRGEDLYAFLPLPLQNLSALHKEMIEDACKKLHQGLELKHYSTADFVITPRGIYVIDVNSAPHLYDDAILPKALEQVGANMPDFLDHVIKQALKR
jgi:D-alanine-D-alanine ligase-like ATP-grasp enzyme